MIPPKCPRCQQSITVGDTLTFDGNSILHLDCRRPRDLSREERALLFMYCFDHAVAACTACAKTYRQTELGSDMIGNRSHLCPTCREDLTETMRQHLYGCGKLPDNVSARAREAREAAQRLIKASQQAIDRADVLMREAEAGLLEDRKLLQNARAAFAALREAMGQRPSS